MLCIPRENAMMTTMTRLTLALCAAAMPLAAQAQGTPEPGSPRVVAMEHMRAILDAEPSALEEVLRTAVAPSLFEEWGQERVLGRFTEIRDALADATPRGARPLGPTSLTMVFDRGSAEASLTLSLEPEDPHRLTGVELDLPGGAGVAASGTAASGTAASGSAMEGGDGEAASAEGYPSVEALVGDLIALLERGDFRAAAERQTLPALRERFGVDELTNVFREVRNGIGGSGEPITLTRIVQDEGETGVHVQAPDGGEMRFTLFTTTEAPFLVRGVDTNVTRVHAGPAPSPEDWPDLIRDFVDARAERGEFSGAVAVGRYGEPLFAEAWGWADAENGRRVTPDTPINLGSMNKMFTGLALAQLRARGLVDFQAPVGDYLPDYPNETIRTESNLHQLLTHTSGIPSYWNAAYQAGRDTLDTVEEIASTFVREPLSFEPGAMWEYSNGGPVVAGMILEAVTGTSYYDYVREHVYGPAGMSRTDHYRKTDAASGIAIGYGSIVDGTPREPNTAGMGIIGSPAGGGYSTVMDLIRFAAALDDGALLPREALEGVWSPPRDGAEEQGYGYLWGSGVESGQRWVGHNGGGPGVSADFRYFPDSGYVVVVLSNVSRGAMPVSQWLADLVARSLNAGVAS
jgi:CubicO group peptidase (beta-lactamase class C family)